MADEWKDKLTPEQYAVLREKRTEAPGTGALLHNHDSGEYMCAACGNLLFFSESKYDTNTPGLIGWPSFDEAANNDHLRLVEDHSDNMHRVAVTCVKCDSHLGHIFPDPESATGKHYCINSAALDFKERA